MISASVRSFIRPKVESLYEFNNDFREALNKGCDRNRGEWYALYKAAGNKLP